MEKLTLELSHNRYNSKKSDKNIKHLSLFLDEIRDYVLGYKQWALNIDEDFGYTEFTELYKKDGVITIIMDDVEDGTEFQISIDQFVYVLDEWIDLQRQRPKRIIIVSEGVDSVKVYGEEFPDPPYVYFKDEYMPDAISVTAEGNFEMEFLLEGKTYGWDTEASGSWNILANFISHDLSWYGSEYYRIWLANSTQNKLSGDVAFIMKKDNFILIKYLSTLRDPDEYFALTKEQFLKLLDDWEKLWRVKPKKIQVSCKNGDVAFTPEYEWQEA